MSRRRPAFDPTRLDDLDELLPALESASPIPPAEPATAALESTPANDQASEEQAAITQAPRMSKAESTPRRARGQGGRPHQQRPITPATVESARVPVAVRIPRPLYEDINIQLLAGPERPSYGQLVVWTCEDHPKQVATEVQNARPQPGSRRPRGRRLAADTVQVTLRLTVKERSLLDDIANTIRATHPGLITRTEVATAALRCALNTPPAQ
ncbi:MAG: hypothetical protein JO287_10030 [Pseudonocardiales bacterium]|nr:hypothetical protein [Pseudonocardiales bacterium]